MLYENANNCLDMVKSWYHNNFLSINLNKSSYIHWKLQNIIYYVDDSDKELCTYFYNFLTKTQNCDYIKLNK